MSNTKVSASGQSLWNKIPKANTELFALTYGSLVTELIRDYGESNLSEINSQLESIGHSIGGRCIDELFAKSELSGIYLPSCSNLRDTADVLAKVGFRMFLGMNAEVANFRADGRGFSLFLYDNPLSIFVELPTNSEEPEEGGTDWSQLKYSNIYCGVIKGALEQVNLRVECDFVKDVLRGDDVNEIRVDLKEVMAEGAGDDYKEE